ncbi:hypothetical protein MRX96_040172 [Rhipicephalus microplus]
MGVSTSLVVSTAHTTFRIGRALGLIKGEEMLYFPRSELALSVWLSGSAVVIASHTYTAALSLGLTWASVNGLGLPGPKAIQASCLHVTTMTSGRVFNAVDSKRDLYVNHHQLAFGAIVRTIRTGGEWKFGERGWIPLAILPAPLHV